MFKVGDWVRHKAIYAQNIKPISVVECRGLTFVCSEGVTRDCDRYNLWQPRVGDYCWSYNDGLVKVLNITSIGYECEVQFLMQGYILTYSIEALEPFIGSLPNSIKEGRDV
jgi:hypothetical protein